MSHERFRDTGEGSFFGNLVYERAVPTSHFLRQVRELVDWEALAQDGVALYKGGAEYGPPPYHPSLVLKVLVLASLYDLSERQVERFVHDRLSAKYFLGLAADEPPPEAGTTLSVFKGRVREQSARHALRRCWQRQWPVPRASSSGGSRWWAACTRWRT